MRAAISCLGLCLGIAGCYAPAIPNGQYLCTDTARSCPAGFQCDSCGTCVEAGASLDAGVCLSCQGLIACFMMKSCVHKDTACENACITQGTPKAAALGRATITCVNDTCASRCDASPFSFDCGVCRGNTTRGPNSVVGGCFPADEPSCNACVTQYNACSADQ